MTQSAYVSLMARLEALPGRFASNLLRLDTPQIDGAIIGMLETTGDALEADWATLEEYPDCAGKGGAARAWRRPGTGIPGEAAVVLPVHAGSRHICTLTFGRAGEGCWPVDVVDRLRPVADLIAMAVERQASSAADTPARADPGHATPDPWHRFDREARPSNFDEIIGDSAALRVAISRVQEVAPTDASVVLFGETGTGKELFARAVHARSPRRNHPFICVNCAALPPTLIESEFFGHERGAFTGAIGMRQGRFELAHKGTIFLDEIGDLAPDVQVKLLRVLQEGEFQRVGSSQPRVVDVRIVAATHHDLEAAVKAGRFRADLYYRLAVFPIWLPSLRDHSEDIPQLVWFFVNKRQRALNRHFTRIENSTLAALQEYAWPGNVRELENVIERAMIHSTGNTLSLDEVPGIRVSAPDVSRGVGTLEEMERRHIEGALRRSGWRINGPGNAAESLGIHPNTLRFRMKKLGIRRPVPGPAVVVGDFRRVDVG